MNKFARSLAIAFAIALFGVVVAEAISPTESNAAEKKRVVKKQARRGLASLAPVREGGQGVTMLDNVRESNPAFLSGAKKKAGPVRLSGVCRDIYGMTYYSGAQDAAYANCLSGQGAQAGNVDTYWGAAQRQTGAGISITGR